MNERRNRPDWSRLDRQDLADRSPSWPHERPVASVQNLAAELAGAEVVAAAEDLTWLEADREQRQAQARQYRGLGAGEPGE